jgi:hypothetical protein
MAGHSRPKDGVASACLCPAIHILRQQKKDVDARHEAGHDGMSIASALPLHRLPADIAAAEAFRPSDAIDRGVSAGLRFSNGLA